MMKRKLENWTGGVKEMRGHREREEMTKVGLEKNCNPEQQLSTMIYKN